WLLDTPTAVAPVWGEGDRVLWAAGEPMMIVGPDGVGKTTLSGHLLYGLAGIVPTVLGFPVAPAKRRVLYVAADRPNQAQRRFRQILEQGVAEDLEHERAELRERVAIHKGPLPFDIVREERRLASFVQESGA